MASLTIYSSDVDGGEISIHGVPKDEFSKWAIILLSHDKLSNGKVTDLASGSYLQFKIFNTEITLFREREA